MRKWLIGLGSIVLLQILLGFGLAWHAGSARDEPSQLCQASVTLKASPVAWISGLGAGRRHRPYRNPARLKRLSKKARLRLLRRLGVRPRRRRRSRDARSPAELPSASDPWQLASRVPEALSAPASETPEASPAKRGPGRPASIPTNHVFCPTQGCRGYGQLGPHPDHHIVGCGTYDTNSGKRQLFRCELCKTRFSETQGTVFFGLKTKDETVYRALANLAEGTGIRATARVFGVKPDDVLRWLQRAGEHAEQVSAHLMRNLHVEQAQLDELWTFVRKKEKRLSAWEQLHSEYGDTWVWTVFDPVNKLVLALLVGEREQEQAVGVLQRLQVVLAEGCLPLFTSDQLPHYLQALLQVFGRWVQPERKGTRGRFPKPRPEAPDDLHYATVHKEREGGYVVSVTTQVVFGKASDLLTRLRTSGIGRTINTAFVERMNLSLRHLVSRLKRRGLNFSKKRKYLVWHLQLAVGYYHFVRTHRGLRQRLPEPLPTRGTPKKWAQRTPAMAAGLTDQVWTIQELLMFRVPPLAA